MFDLAAFLWASLDWILLHPLVQAALLGTAAAVVWKLGLAIRREARHRAVQRVIHEEIIKAAALGVDNRKRFQ